MTPKDMEEVRRKALTELATINTAHTQENLDRLRIQADRQGWKLTGTLRRKSAFTLRAPNGTSIAGLTLADAEKILNSRRSQPDV